MLILTDDEVLAKSFELVGFDERRQAHVMKETSIMRFKDHYGSIPRVYAQLWEDLQTTAIADAHVEGDEKQFTYFMGALHFLTVYPTEKHRSGIFKHCETNCREWGWCYLKKISALNDEKIRWPNDWVDGNDDLPYFLFSVDGTHCFYHEVKHLLLPYDPQMYSHKTNKPGLAYEVALSLHQMSKVVSIRGPFKASVHDNTTFNSHLRNLIPDGCVGIADRGYRGTPEYKDFDHQDAFRDHIYAEESAEATCQVRTRPKLAWRVIEKILHLDIYQ